MAQTVSCAVCLSAATLCLWKSSVSGEIKFEADNSAYPGVLTAAKTQRINAVGVAMDGEGILPEALDETMATWDEEARGSRKPRVLLMVP